MNYKDLFKNITVSYGEDLTIHDPNEIVEKLVGEREPTLEDIARFKRIAAVNMNILNQNYSVIKDEVSHLNLEDLALPTADWFIFNRMSFEDREELKHSIKNYGLFTPLIVWEMTTGKHLILSGIERFEVYQELYEESSEDKKEKYKTIPCFVLGKREINDVLARIIRIDSNICVRNMNIQCKNRALCVKYKALQFLNKARKDLGVESVNILDELSSSFNMSRTGVVNHLSVLKVNEEFLYLFQEGKLTLKSIKKLSKFSAEDQKKIYDGMGMENIKDIQIAAMSEKGIEDSKRLDQSIEILKEMTAPTFTNIKIKIPTRFVKEAIELLEGFIKRNIRLMMKMRKPKIN